MYAKGLVVRSLRLTILDEAAEVPYLDDEAHILLSVEVDVATKGDDLLLAEPVKFIDIDRLCVYLVLLADLHVLREI